MQVDLALNPFDADVRHLVEVGRAAEGAGVDGLWVADHFSGAVVGRAWSRDPFVCLGALAVATTTARLGPLVLNVRNRHPAQTASASNSLSSLAQGRVVLGLGAGASPGSRFAVEHDAIGTDLGTASSRRTSLVDHLAEVRRLHELGAAAGATSERPAGETDALAAVTDGAPCPPIVIGASAASIVDLAARHADGVNLRSGPRVRELVDAARAVAGADFEVSVLEWAGVSSAAVADYESMGVDRVVVGVDAERSPEEVVDLVTSLRAVG